MQKRIKIITSQTKNRKDMKRNIIRTFIIAVAAVFAVPQTADAQIGNLLKKAKKAVETVTGTTDAKTAEAKDAGTQATEVAIASGGTMINPFSDAADIELVGCYGKSTSENFGTAYLVLKVKMKPNKNRIILSGNENGNKTMAIDADGNSYGTSAMGGMGCDVTEGVFVKLKVDAPQQQFKDVKKSVKEFQLIKMSIYIDPQYRGALTFKNVPIQWDVEPE